MKNNLRYIYTLLFLAITGSAYARPTLEMNSISTAMFTFLAIALVTFLITYVMWKFNELKRRKVVNKFINRGPVKRDPVSYIHKKRSAAVEQVK